MKKIRLTESDLIKIVKRVIKENKDMIRIPREYSGVRMELGTRPTPEDIIDAYNTTIEEGTPLVSYSDGVFYNEDNMEIPVDTVLDELNYAIVGEEEDDMGDSPKRKRFGDGNENEIYLTNNVRFHRKGDRLTLSYTPTEVGGGLTISDEQKKMLIDFLTKN
jgi:hypothetical protein